MKPYLHLHRSHLSTPAPAFLQVSQSLPDTPHTLTLFVVSFQVPLIAIIISFPSVPIHKCSRKRFVLEFRDKRSRTVAKEEDFVLCSSNSIFYQFSQVQILFILDQSEHLHPSPRVRSYLSSPISSSSSLLPAAPQKGWSKRILKNGERSPWTGGRDD